MYILIDFQIVGKEIGFQIYLLFGFGVYLVLGICLWDFCILHLLGSFWSINKSDYKRKSISKRKKFW